MSSPARVLAIVHEDDAGLGRLAATAAFGAADLDVRRPARGDPVPTTPDGADALVVLGGSMAAWQDDVAPWLAPTRRLLAAAVGRELPTLGICLGAQLLALATGGTVTPGDRGLEVGLVRVSPTPDGADDELLGPVLRQHGPELDVVHWHGDAVTMLPPGARLLATAPRYPHQAFRLGRRAWGVQYHPEVTAADWARWVDLGRERLAVEGRDVEAMRALMSGHEDRLQSLAAAHAEAFAALW